MTDRTKKAELRKKYNEKLRTIKTTTKKSAPSSKLSEQTLNYEHSD